MNWNFTLKRCFKRLYLLFLAFFFFVPVDSHAQISYVYANQLLGNNSHVAAPGNAVSVSTTDYATLESYGGIAINLGSYTGRIELGFPTTVPAGTTSYVRIQTDATLLNTLLGGGLGGALANLTGTIALGNHYFEVRAKETGNATPVFTASSINGFANENARLVYDSSGRYYIAITPSVAYNSIEIEDFTNTLLLGTINTMRVYSAFHFSGSDVCNPAFATSFDGTGGTVDILGVGGAGVANPNLAIDNSNTTFSQVSQGVLTVAGTISQTIYFATPSAATDQFHLVLQLDDPSLLNLGVSDGIKIEALNGTSVVYSTGLGSLLNLDLLGLLSAGQKTDVAFSPGQAFDRVKVTISSLVQLNVTKTVKIFDVYRSPAKPTVTAGNQSITICSGQTVNLTASTASTNELVWFNSLTGTTPLAVTAYNVPHVLNNVTASATYYVATRQIGCTGLSERVPITVTVNALPVASDITISANVNASCAGVAVLAPTTALTGGVFKYYTDQNKTQEITTGFSGHAGITYSKNATTGALTISGLNASNTPRNYYISIEVAGMCENAINTLAAVQVGLGAETPLTVLATISGCGFVNLRDAITNFDTSNTTTYTFYDSSNNPITAAAAANITTSGTYYIEATNPADACASARKPVVVTVNPLPTLQVNPATYTVNLGDSVTLQSTSNATVTWYNQSGTALGSNVAGPFTTAGYYTFTAVANNGLCSVSLSVTVNVIDPANCPVFLDRVYADTQTSGSIITGGVTNGALAIDHNPQTFSTITTGLGLLGIGTTWQNIQWNTTIPAGTPITVKVGSEFSGLALLGAVTVIGTKRDGLGNPIDIGTLQQLSGTLLNLLPGENNFEYTFVPSNSTGPKAYDGIRIQIGSVLSVAQSARVYEAYYHKVADPVVCQPGDIEDVFYGNIDLGIGALTSTVGVTNAWNAVDNNHTTFATMTTGVGVLAASELTVKFRSVSQENDVVKVLLSRPATVLNLGLIAGFSIQRYMGNNPVGPLLDGSGTLLTLQLLNGGTEALLVTNANSPAFDRVRIRFGGAASVLNALQIHSVTREAAVDVVGSGGDRIIEVCYGDVVSIAPIDCTTFNWYDAPTGGNLVTSGTSYTIPYSLTVGSHNFYLQPVRSGCEVMERTQITITVRATSPQASLTGIQINSGTNTTLCSPSGAVTLTAQLNSTPAVTNPIYYWYSFDGTNQTLIAGQSTATLALTGLTPGTYTYYVGVSSDQYCATLPAERRSVTFTILPASTAADITVSDVQHCLVNPAPITIQPTSTLTNPVFTWYFTNDITQPITNGTVSGVTYSIAANGTLTISGLTTATYTYYVGVVSDNTCLNLPGSLQDAVVQVSNAPTPTTNDTTQDFCKVNNPIIESILVNEAGVIWYNVPTGGTPLASTTPLVTGTYYGVLIDATSGCESAVRLAVAVQVNDAPTPTTNDTTQDFCKVTNPIVESILVNEAGVIWYNVPTGGTPLASTTPLVSGIYYAVLVDATSGCESSVRLAVTVQVNDAPTPTTNDTTQDFCKVTNPIVESIIVNEAGVIWYNVATGGTPLASTTPLVSGIYYAVLIDAVSGCESSVRLAVTVQVNDAPTPTTNDTTQDFCQSTNPIVESIIVNEAGVIWYNVATGGTPLAPTTPLVSGIYYAVLIDAASGCESSVRLAVTVQINDAPTPTTNDATQEFCQSTNPTIASIQVNETGVIWYDSSTGGTVVASTTPLTTGTYYGVLVDATSGCESSVRLAVAVQINDAPTPTTNDATQDFCQSTNPTIASIQVNETGVIWYNAATGGTVVAPTTPLVTGTYYGVLIDAASGCESSVRLVVAVQVNDAPTPTTNDTTQEFCQSTNPTIASIQVNETGVIWYNASTGGTVIVSTTPLTTGTYYGVLVDPTSGCESSVRLAVAVEVNDAPTPTTNDATQDFCQSTNPTIASIQVNETGVIWYNAATGGTVVTPTTPLVTGTYYGVLVDPTSGCESSVRLAVAVQVNDAPTPTTNDSTQDFCQSTNPTIASIQVNETGVIWYNAATGGTVVASTTPLTTGTYYGVLVDATSGCESSVRLAVAVEVNDAPTPTTNDTTQDFCLTTNPTVASIQVNETGVIWYDAPTGGTIVASTTPLVSGTTYYGVLVDPTSGCESSIRLAVSVQVNDAPTPTTNDTTQEFCQSTNPTIASIQVNETGVIWYNAATGGTVVTSTTPLTTGTYYGVLVDPASGCESSIRLAVAVQVNDAPTPTTNDTTQDFCQTANPTVASIQVNETGVIWYNAPTGGTVVPSNTPLTAGTYYGVLVDPVTGCESSIRLAVTVQFFNGTQATISGGSPTACIQDQVTYTTNTGMSNYVWVVSSGGQIVNGGTTTDNTITVLWNQIGANTVSVSYSDANGCSTSNSAAMNLEVVNCSDITITKSVDNPTPFIDDNVVFTITVTNTGQAQFQNIIVNEAIPNGYAFVSMVVSHGTYNNNTGIWTIPTLNANQVATLQLTVKVLFSGDYLNTATITSSDPVDVDVNNNTASASVEPKCLVVYNEFTPNDDGANDVFTIKCAEHFPNNSLEVFNRYGNLVYKTRYYQNDWKGISNVNGTFDGSVLPTGTYYYVFDTGDNSGTVKTGWVYIMR